MRFPKSENCVFVPSEGQMIPYEVMKSDIPGVFEQRKAVGKSRLSAGPVVKDDTLS